MPSRWDIERAILYSKVPSTARLIVLVLAIKSDNDSAIIPAEHTPSLTTISEMTGVSRGSLTEWLIALESAGWVKRSKPAKRGSKTERTTYALAVGSDDVVLRDRSKRIPKPRKGAEEVPSSPRGGREESALLVREADAAEPASSPHGGHLLVRMADPSSPRGGHALTTPLPTGEGTTKNHQPAPSAGEVVNSSTRSAPKWSTDNEKPTTPTVLHGKIVALFPKPKPAAVGTWMEIHQIIYRWLRANGYESLGLDEVKQIHTGLIAAHPGKALRYLISVVSNGGCAPYAQAIRVTRNEKIAEVVREMQAILPQCPHGSPAGEHPHPTTGRLLCVQCHRGIPAQQVDDATAPEVQAALDAYRAARGNDIFFAELLSTTQQIEAFLAEGATPEQVAGLAALAGEQRISLIKAAGVAA